MGQKKSLAQCQTSKRLSYSQERERDELEGIGEKNAGDRKNKEIGRKTKSVRQVRAMLCYHPRGVSNRI